MRFVGDSRVSADKTSQVPKDYSEYPGRTEAFWPNFLLKEWLVGSVFLIGFLTATAVSPSPLEGVANPSDASYLPLPDWYFLFLYQLLKYQFAAGDYVLIGILVIPGIDRKSTRLNSSHVAISYAVFCLKKKTTK